MNSKTAKAISISVCAAIVTGGVGAVSYAAGADKKQTEPASEQISLIAEEEDAELVKDETVYVLAGADGSVQKIIVSDWIKNTAGLDSIADKSELGDVENVKGSESYVMNGDNMRVWDAQGGDIYCRGSIEKELPVNLSVSYKLDGKSISPSELAGKSGRVTIRFDYENMLYENTKIGGRTEKIYVPFVMLTGLLLDSDNFTNVDVTNGKLINDGSRTAVIGLAFPGLQDNLGADSEKLEIPSYVEITADVREFEMTNTITVAANEVFSRLNSDAVDSVDGLTESIDEMTDAMEQLTNGSSQLYDGICTLLDKSGELISGIDKLAEGGLKLKNGAEKLNGGAAQLSDGAGELAGGLGALTANNDTLNAGSRQVFESLLSMADSQLAAAGLSAEKLTIDNYPQVLNGVIAALDKDNIAKQAQAAARQTVTAKVNEQKETVRAAVSAKVQEEVTAKVSDAVRANVKTQVLAAMGMTVEAYESGIAAGAVTAEQQAQVNAAVDAQMETEAVKAAAAANVSSQMQSADIKNMIAAKTDEQVTLLIEQNMNSPEVQAQITAALEKAASGAASISALKEQLDSYNQFYLGLGQYTAGVASAKSGADQLNAGASELKNGTAELYSGSCELYDGILKLKNGAPALTDGVSQLRDGAMKLSDGLEEFNEQGVQRLADAVDGDIEELLERVRATIDVSKNYKAFSGLSDEMDGQVKFIYRTEAIDKEQ